jgi:hypothetical protein
MASQWTPFVLNSTKKSHDSQLISC